MRLNNALFYKQNMLVTYTQWCVKICIFVICSFFTWNIALGTAAYKSMLNKFNPSIILLNGNRDYKCSFSRKIYLVTYTHWCMKNCIFVKIKANLYGFVFQYSSPRVSVWAQYLMEDFMLC